MSNILMSSVYTILLEILFKMILSNPTGFYVKSPLNNQTEDHRRLLKSPNGSGRAETLAKPDSMNVIPKPSLLSLSAF